MNPPTPGKGQHRYALEAFNFVGEEPRIFRWLFGLEMTRKLLRAQDAGHTTNLAEATFIDEGLHIFSKELFLGPADAIASPKRALLLNRFLGNALLIGAQNLTLLDAFVAQNCATHVVFRCSDLVEAQAGAKLLGLPPDRAPELQSLKPGEAWVRSVGWEQPVKVRVPFMVQFGAYPSAEYVRQRLEAELAWLRAHNVYGNYPEASSQPIDFISVAEGKAAESGGTGGASPAATALLAEHYRFLADVRAYPQDGLKARYERLQVGVAKGNRLLAELKAIHCLSANHVPSPAGGRGRLIVSLTALGQEWLDSYERQSRP